MNGLAVNHCCLHHRLVLHIARMETVAEAALDSVFQDALRTRFIENW